MKNFVQELYGYLSSNSGVELTFTDGEKTYHTIVNEVTMEIQENGVERIPGEKAISVDCHEILEEQ